MTSPLAPDTPPEAALRQIVAACHADLLKYRAVVLASRRAIGIHQSRVALRRLRAALGLFRGAMPGEAEQRQIRALAAEAKFLAGECGPARDLYVFMSEIVEVPPPAVKRIANRLARVHLERARAALGGARFAAFDAQIAAFIAMPEHSGGRLDAFGRDRLERLAAKVERRGQGLAGLDEQPLHRLRIAVKKLRYAATFLRPAFASRAPKAYIEATVRLQGALGALNDRAVAAQIVDDLAGAARPTEKVERALRQLAKQASGGDKKRRQKLERAWKTFRKAERFWRA